MCILSYSTPLRSASRWEHYAIRRVTTGGITSLGRQEPGQIGTQHDQRHVHSQVSKAKRTVLVLDTAGCGKSWKYATPCRDAGAHPNQHSTDVAANVTLNELWWKRASLYLFLGAGWTGQISVGFWMVPDLESGPYLFLVCVCVGGIFKYLSTSGFRQI